MELDEKNRTEWLLGYVEGVAARLANDLGPVFTSQEAEALLANCAGPQLCLAVYRIHNEAVKAKVAEYAAAISQS